MRYANRGGWRTRWSDRDGAHANMGKTFSESVEAVVSRITAL